MTVLIKSSRLSLVLLGSVLFFPIVMMKNLMAQPIATPSLDFIIAKMEQAKKKNQAGFRAFTVTRDYALFGKEEKSVKSQVIADVSFTPPGSKSFSIRQSRGSGMGESIVKRMLTGEAELANSDKSDISSENYSFRLIGQSQFNGRPCYLIELCPKRKDKSLLSGKAWIDAQTYLVHHAEGEPMKKPSWWVRNIHISLSYGNVNGMWLQTGLVATAQVRIMGPCKVVARDVSYAIADAASTKPSAVKNPRRKSAS